MFETVKERWESQDIIIKAAAVADYTPVQTAEDKIKKKDDDMTLALNRTQDILAWLGQHKKENQVLCGFSMETRDVLENSTAKLNKKNADMIAANCLKEEGAGFGTDTNHLSLICQDGVVDLPMLTKEAAADRLLDALNALWETKNT